MHEEKFSEQLPKSIFTLAGIIFFSSLIIAGTIFFSAKTIEQKISAIPAPTILQNAPQTTKEEAAAPETKDTSLSYIGTSLNIIESTNPPKTPSLEGVMSAGNKDAKVTVVEYSDYECPFCYRYYQATISQFQKEYVDTGKVRFIYKDFPLHTIHPKAVPAANAARCAGDQGKYYEMHNLLFGKYEEWVGGSNLKASFLGFADQLGLNKGTFESCLTNFTHKDAIEKDYTEGYYLGVRGTPSTFINGNMIVNSSGKSAGNMDYATLKAEIEKALAAK